MTDPRRNDVPINTETVTELMDRIEDTLDGLNGVTERATVENSNKNASRAKADINRRLLFAAHLARVLEIEIMNQYQIFRGENPPGITPYTQGGKGEYINPAG